MRQRHLLNWYLILFVSLFLGAANPHFEQVPRRLEILFLGHKSNTTILKSLLLS
jgi:hypothetical protein